VRGLGDRGQGTRAEGNANRFGIHFWANQRLLLGESEVILGESLWEQRLSGNFQRNPAQRSFMFVKTNPYRASNQPRMRVD